MGESCTLIPTVTNQKGEVITSRLYEGLLDYTTPSIAFDIYKRANKDSFYEEFGHTYPLDENGEYLADHIAVIEGLIPESYFIDKLEKQYGRYDDKGKVKAYDYDSISKIARMFNKENPLNRIVNMKVIPSYGNKYHIKINSGPFN